MRQSLQGCKLSAGGVMLMKQALFLILDEHAEWEVLTEKYGYPFS